MRKYSSIHSFIYFWHVPQECVAPKVDISLMKCIYVLLKA